MLSASYLPQLDWMIALQKISGLASFFKAVTLLGNEEFFLLLIPLVYICVNRRIGVQLGILVLASDALNVLLKLAFAQPRPYWVDPRLIQFAKDTSFGLPSSHAQNAVVVWFFLAYCWQRKHPGSLVYLAAATLVFLISLSRVYLGVHFPTDILGGWLIGAAVLTVFLKNEAKLAASFHSQPSRWLIAAGVVPVLLFSVAALMRVAIGNFGDDLARLAAATGLEAMAGRTGALCGLGVGLVTAQRNAQFSVSGGLVHRLLNFVLVFVGILLFWRGLALVFPKHPETLALTFRFLRYALLTCWVAYWAPLLLLRMRRLQLILVR